MVTLGCLRGLRELSHLRGCHAYLPALRPTLHNAPPTDYALSEKSLLGKWELVGRSHSETTSRLM